jgi:Rps23 Pro-64 3,4-dihydroxylase Tpa1-like proline 4-hydroxylase
MADSFVEALMENNIEKIMQWRTTFTENSPIQCIHIPNFFSAKDALDIVNEWHDISDDRWRMHEKMTSSGNGKKLEISKKELMGRSTATIIEKLQHPNFLRGLSAITGITNLHSDTELYGGGLVNTPTGGFLKVHADFNFYDKIQMYRRLNIIVYMNEYWEDKWGGSLQLWDEGLTTKQAEISPRFNNAILFRVTDKAYHGYPDPLTCPTTTTRKSINIYYYTKDNDTDQSKEPHKTLWKDLNNASVTIDY